MAEAVSPPGAPSPHFSFRESLLDSHFRFAQQTKKFVLSQMIVPLRAKNSYDNEPDVDALDGGDDDYDEDVDDDANDPESGALMREMRVFPDGS